MMKDLTNKRFGRLIALKHIGKNKFGSINWVCKCDCGNTKVVPSLRLVGGDTKSCGCYKWDQHAKKVRLSLVNKKFGKLKVIKLEFVTKQRTYWRCQCDCGNQSIVIGSNLTRGGTKSCGCRKHTSDTLEIQTYNAYRCAAKKRDIAFNITKDEFKSLIKQNCYYCNLIPSNVKKRDDMKLLYSGVDRKNNKLGYSLKNCVPCCQHCNFAKRELNVIEFKEFIKRAYNHLFKDKI